MWVHCCSLQKHLKRTSDPITDVCEPPCGCWELNLAPLEEQPVLLTTEPSLQPSLVHVKSKYWTHMSSMILIIKPGCLSQGFYSCTNIMTKKQVEEERVYSAYTSMLLFITIGSQDWNSSRSWCRSYGGCPLLACFPWLAQPALL